ncbi:hypothetical protein Tco_1324811 [Tanacetum coccineum]
MTPAGVILDGEEKEAVRRLQFTTPPNPTSNITSRSQKHFVTPVHPNTQAVDEAFITANYSQLEPLMRRRMEELRLHVIFWGTERLTLQGVPPLLAAQYKKRRGRRGHCHLTKLPSRTEALPTKLTTNNSIQGKKEVIETALQSLVTTSKYSRDDVKNFYDDVKVADSEKPKEDSTG